jgi:hypothetical protein
MTDMSTTFDPLSPSEIVDAVRLLLEETQTRSEELSKQRQVDLENLYLMNRTLIRGQGFAVMEDLLDDSRTDDLSTRIGEDERKAFDMFMDSYRLADE